MTKRKPQPQLTPEEERQITALWKELQGADKQFEKADNQFVRAEAHRTQAKEQRDERGMKFGAAMYECRAKHSAQGRRTDLVSSKKSDTKFKFETFAQFLKRMHIARKTAYRWIAKHEVLIGERETAPKRTSPDSERTLPEVPEVPEVQNEEGDRLYLQTLSGRLADLATAVLSIVNDKDRFRIHDKEYADVISAGKWLSSHIEQLSAEPKAKKPKTVKVQKERSIA